MKVFDLIGNTPTFEINDESNKIYLKFEGSNIFGSSKDRSAVYVLNKLLKEGTINKDTTIIESSSGNMGVALSAMCNTLGLKFICVIDPHISPINEYLIRSYGAEVIKVTEADENNSYLKTRLATVNKLENDIENSYWFNQYANPLVCEAYEAIGREIMRDIPDADYVFVAVSSVGTIAGVSKAVKDVNPNTKVIGIDVFGSKVFDLDTHTKRYLSGIGSSIQSPNLAKAKIDEHLLIEEKIGVMGAHELLQKHLVFAGGSSGCTYAGIKQYIKNNNLENKKIVGLLNDRGDRYITTIYSKEWCKEKFGLEI